MTTPTTDQFLQRLDQEVGWCWGSRPCLPRLIAHLHDYKTKSSKNKMAIILEVRTLGHILLTVSSSRLVVVIFTAYVQG